MNVAPNEPSDAGSVITGDPPPAVLFQSIWETLVQIIGTAATATLIRRSARCVLANGTEIRGLAIERGVLEPRYSLPVEWQQRSANSFAELRQLTNELQHLLTGLTGSVLVARLRDNQALDRAQLFSNAESS